MIFDKRTAFKPFEYPEVLAFVDAINRSYWIHTEYNYKSDIDDFHLITETEREAIKRSLLAISQIEVSVKSFWGDLYKHFPKPEFNAVGATFAESEVRHSRAYAHLLEILGFNNEFDIVLQEPCIQGRVDYLSKYLRNAGSDNKEYYTLTLALFSLFIENVSLFSQFLIVKSFNKEMNLFKGIDNVIQATAKEENTHALLGSYLINQINKEYPEWFSDEFYAKISRACKKAFDAELKIIDWIFEKGTLIFISKETVVEFVKDRFNKSMELINCEPIFDIDKTLLESVKWFDIEIFAETTTDFFHKTPTAYNKKSISVTENDLF
ncbi:MAG: ribonucleotide reductase [Chryseobacterium sp.]|nr:MAG: ribonucleotide reductase [Chryseobacterium sp.]